MLIASIGLLGAVAAGVVGTHVTWRTAYLIGGLMGLGLLGLRIGLAESEMFRNLDGVEVPRGSILLLLKSPRRVMRYVRCIGAGLVTYLVVGFVVTGAPEFGKAMQLRETPSAGIAVLICYLAMAVGDLVCTLMSQVTQSRKLPLIVFNCFVLSGFAILAFHPPTTLFGFYALCAELGFGCGFWSLVATFAAEQFGTNLRATVTTTVPNFIRAALIPISAAFAFLRPHLGILNAALWLGAMTVALAIVAIAFSPETFGKNIEFLEA